MSNYVCTYSFHFQLAYKVEETAKIFASALQYVQGDEATVPWNVIKQRTVAGATMYTLLGTASFTIVVFYLPIW